MSDKLSNHNGLFAHLLLIGITCSFAGKLAGRLLKNPQKFFIRTLNRVGIIIFDERISSLTEKINVIARTDEDTQRLQQIPGVGPITATAIISAVGDGKQFKCGRDLAAWLGLTPKQHSSGSKERLLGISKRGDAYLRTLLVHGARSDTQSIR